MGVTQNTERQARREDMTAAASRVQTQNGHLVSTLLDLHFKAEDRLIAAERALAAVTSTAWKLTTRWRQALYESRTGTAAHQVKWLRETDRLERQVRDAQAAVDRVRAERERANAAYFTGYAELLNHVDFL